MRLLINKMTKPKIIITKSENSYNDERILFESLMLWCGANDFEDQYIQNPLVHVLVEKVIRLHLELIKLKGGEL